MNASLTIFYRGKMMVFDNFPAMKAESLMEMASKNVNSDAGATTALPLPPEAQASVDLSMPIARRASLHRFLEKRKDRIKNNAPYLFKGLPKIEPTMSEMKSEKKQSWLALGHN
ncbi:protein TIFY 10a-like isoform X2 [Phalaenopsis equestris]|nr:protein TIFY 10a-like isoform X2 [Phalaenopsis equestris]